MARIPEDVLDSIRRSVDLAELVGRYVPVRRTGRSFKACCPFHQEKTPSFNVRPEEGMWKCFGCGKGGNAFTFLMEKEGLRFFEAVQQLARETGVALPEDDDPQAAAAAARMERLRRTAEWACLHFQAALRAPAGEPARAYFKRRGIAGATARDFRLGWAPPGWDHLLAAARDAGVAEADLLDAGLVKRRDGGDGLYDVFRDRVMFPIQDAQGRVIAFGGRVLGEEGPGQPKYLNSPETPLFTKGRNLYAFHLAKQHMLRSGEAAVMEGYTDVLLAHQAGFRVAVAGLGTALTPEQARKLAQYAKKLWLVYDGDAAGLRAAEKAIPSFLPEPIETRVCVLPGGKDPADVFVEDGEPAFRAALADSREAFDHLVAARRAANDETTVPGKTAAVEQCLAALAGVTDDLRRALYVKRLSDAFGLSETVLARKLQDLRHRAAGAARREPAPPPAAPAPRPAVREEPREPGPRDGRVAEAPEDDGAWTSAPPPLQERMLMESLLAAPALLSEAPTWLPEAIGHPGCRRLVGVLLDAEERAGPGGADASRVVATLGDPRLAALAASLAETASRVPRAGLEAAGRECLRQLVLQREMQDLERARTQSAGRPDEEEALRGLVDVHRRRAEGRGAAGRARSAPGGGGAGG